MEPSPFDGYESVIRETTDQFCDVFVRDRDYYGPFARAVAHGSLPHGVDPHDPRVVEIRRKCRERSEEEPEAPFTD